MRLNTKHFGEIDVEEDKLISFQEGIPGFAHLQNFVLMADSEQSSNQGNIFYWLQSVENPETAFVLVDMIQYNPDYNPLVEENQIAELGNFNPDTFRIYNIAVLPEDANDMTVNLKAPLVINTESKKGKQVICNNEDYTVRHYMFR